MMPTGSATVPQWVWHLSTPSSLRKILMAVQHFLLQCCACWWGNACQVSKESSNLLTTEILEEGLQSARISSMTGIHLRWSLNIRVNQHLTLQTAEIGNVAQTFMCPSFPNNWVNCAARHFVEQGNVIFQDSCLFYSYTGCTGKAWFLTLQSHKDTSW